MKIISFVSQKGGVGKSTLALATAYEASKSGLSVKVADMDTQQGTLSDLHRQRLDNGIPSIGSVEIFATISDLKKSLTNSTYDFLVIDGTPRASKGTLAAGKISDLIVLPCCSSRADLIPTLKLGHELVKNQIPHGNIVFALSRVNTASEINDAREFITETGFKVLDGCVFEKPGYRQAQNDGYALTETKWKSLNDKANIVLESILTNLLSE